MKAVKDQATAGMSPKSTRGRQKRTEVPDRHGSETVGRVEKIASGLKGARLYGARIHCRDDRLAERALSETATRQRASVVVGTDFGDEQHVRYRPIVALTHLGIFGQVGWWPDLYRC